MYAALRQYDTGPVGGRATDPTVEAPGVPRSVVALALDCIHESGRVDVCTSREPLRREVSRSASVGRGGCAQAENRFRQTIVRA